VLEDTATPLPRSGALLKVLPSAVPVLPDFRLDPRAGASCR
jgi:hypothetical protein